MIDFLDAGKGVYIEGANFSSHNEGSPLYGKLGTKLTGVGNFWQTGNIQAVSGQTSSLVDGLDYNYLYQQPPDNLLDYIESDGGTILFKSQDGLGRAVSYKGLSNTYRAIHITFIFGALINGTHSKNDLMETYMDYLTGNTAVEEYEDDVADEQLLSVYPNPFSKLTTISFEVDSRQKSVFSVKIYDISGRLVKSFGSLPSAPSPMRVTWDGTDDSSRQVSNGTYIVRIKTERDVINKTVVLIN